MLIKLKKHIKKISIVSGIIGIVSAGVLVSKMKLGAIDIPLTEVPEVKTQIGEQYWNIFKDKNTGKEIKIETTKDDYFYHTIGKGSRPTYPNARLVSAYGGTPFYDISIPVLQDYEYYVEDKKIATGTSPVLIKLPNMAVKEVPGSYTVDNKLTPIEINDLTK